MKPNSLLSERKPSEIPNCEAPFSEESASRGGDSPLTGDADSRKSHSAHVHWGTVTLTGTRVTFTSYRICALLPFHPRCLLKSLNFHWLYFLHSYAVPADCLLNTNKKTLKNQDF